ncbi:hypothetical protein ATO49_27540 [Mycolicibacterium fortuitum subsp. fortuitum DSM 46621 = ATCC 6841 = JCM 6387]|nr:hypothetical protein ATO49_27540 [Mycolicibacterium fortuitum subsp. fortuitum DSM 46621 = ATCC 6841 = JCM 6387]
MPVPPPPGLAAAAGVAPVAVPVIALPVIVPPIAVPLGAPDADHGPRSGPRSGPEVQSNTKMRTEARQPAAVGLDAAIPVAFRAGYTDYLRTANTKEIAAVALPGVTGMMALTGLGGLVGYRQAKAGRTVRIDVSRFMR